MALRWTGVAASSSLVSSSSSSNTVSGSDSWSLAVAELDFGGGVAAASCAGCWVAAATAATFLDLRWWRRQASS